MTIQTFFSKMVNGKIKNKLILYSIILLLFNLITIGTISYIISSTAVMRRISTTNNEILSKSMESIDFLLNSIENSAIQVFDDLDIDGLIEQARYGDENKELQVESAINKAIYKLIYMRNEIDLVYIIGDNYTRGNIKGIYSNENYARLQVLNEDMFKKMLENKEDQFVWTYVVKEETNITPSKRIGLCRAIRDRNGAYRGFILIMLREGTLQDIYENFLQQKRQVYLVDTEDIIASSVEKELIGSKISNDYMNVRSGDTSVKILGNKKQVISNVTSQYTGWKLYVVEPYENLVSSIKNVKLWIIISVLTCILVSVFLSVYLSTTLTKPIKTLKDLASSVRINTNRPEEITIKPDDNRKRKKIFKKLNFRHKLFIMLISIILIPITILMVISYNLSYNIIKSKAIEINMLKTRQTRIRLEYYLSSFEKSIYDLYSENDFNLILRRHAFEEQAEKNNEVEKNLLANTLTRIVDTNRDIIYIQLFDAKYNLLYCYGSHKQITPKAAFDIIDSFDVTKNVWYGPYINYYNQNVITLGKKIRDINDYVTLGYISVSLKESDLEQVYGNHMKDNGYYYIIDNNGCTISHPDKSQLGKKLNYSYIDQIIDGVEKSMIIKDAGEELLVNYDEVRNNDWKIVNVSSISSISGDINKMLVYYLIALGLNSIIIAFIALRVSRKVGKPLTELGSRVMSFAENNMDVGQCKIITGDEIEQLSDSFYNMVYRIENLIEEVYKSKIKEHEAELNSKNAELTLLQTQINPHFLYNTLEIIRWKAMFLTGGENEVTDIVSALSDFFRLSLSKGMKIIKLLDEIEHAKNYIIIMNYRYNNKITVNWHIEDDTVLECQVPKIILQPLIENAIYHGIKAKQDEGIIDIYARSRNDGIELEVKDNGVGMNSEEVLKLNEHIKEINAVGEIGYGLRNVNQRVKLNFGENYGLHIESEPNIGTSIIIFLPEAKV